MLSGPGLLSPRKLTLLVTWKRKWGWSQDQGPSPCLFAPQLVGTALDGLGAQGWAISALLKVLTPCLPVEASHVFCTFSLSQGNPWVSVLRGVPWAKASRGPRHTVHPCHVSLALTVCFAYFSPPLSCSHLPVTWRHRFSTPQVRKANLSRLRNLPSSSRSQVSGC